MPTQLRLSSRSQVAAKPMDAPRRREMVCNLLTQIFELAERTRVSRHRAASSEESEPISLIELIQASYAVFERYGIGPPDDAVYHRYLLSLSINPERDWRKKLLNFDLETQPRVKRLCSAVEHRHGASQEKLAQDSGVQKRQRSGSKHDLVRRASLISTDTGKANSGFVPKDQRQQDQFDDMLSLDSPIQRLDSRKAFPKIANSKSSPNEGLERKIRVVPAPAGINDEALLSTSKESAKTLPPDRKLQMITTSIEQWRATQAVKQLVDQGKAQDDQTYKQKIVTRCTEAIFHWVTQSLPEKIDFHATESPRALPLRILRRISVDVDSFKKSARRIWVWQTKTLLRAWHRDAQRLKAFRVRMIVKQRAAALETVFRCIQSWRLFTETKKCSLDRAQWITQRRSRVKLRECLEHWQRVFHGRKRQNRVNRQYLGCVMKIWQNTVESKRIERNRFKMAKMRRIFSCWEEAKERQQAVRALLAVSSSQRRLRLLSCSWNQLRANVTRNETERTRMSLWKESSLERWKQRAFRLWKLAVEQQKDFRDREKRFLRYSRRRYLRQSFAFWSSWTERQLIIEKLLSDAAEARVSLCFTGWKEHFEDSLRAEEELTANVMRLGRKTIWDRWRKSTAACSATRCLDSAYSLHLLTTFFSNWKKYTSKKAELHFAFVNWQDLHKRKVLIVHWSFLVANMNAKHQKQLAAECFGVNRLVQRKRVYLSAWKRFICATRERRLRAEQLQHSVRQCLTQSVWANWRRAFWMKTVDRLADDQLHSYRKSHRFRLWNQFAHEAKQRRLRALKVAEMLENFHLKMCFGLWKKLQTAKHQLAKGSEVVRQKTRARMLATRWETWREALEFKRKQLEKVSSATSRWQSRKLYASFHSWKTTWSIRKRHCKLLQSMSLVSKQRVVEIHFHTWRKSCRVSVARERQLVEIFDKMMRFKAKQAVRRWNSICLDQNKRNRVVVKSIALWRQSLLSSAFKRLSHYQHRRKKRKTQSELIRSRYRTQSMRRVFAAWSTWFRGRDLILKRFESTRCRLEALKRMRALRKLRQNVHSRKTLRTAYSCIVTMKSGHVKVAVLTRWKAFIGEKHTVRERNAARAIAMRNFRVRKGIGRWKNYVKTRRIMKIALTRAVTASNDSLLQQSFANWKKCVTRLSFTRDLKQKAATFRYFSFLSQYFRFWKTFRCEMKHKRELLLRARCLWCHQTESRAFKAWVEFTVTTCKTKRAVDKWKNQTVSKRFVSWSSFASLQKKNQREQIIAVNFYEQRICLRILRKWSSTARHNRLARNSAQMWRQNAFQRSFATWKLHVRLRQTSRKVVAKLRFLTVTQVFTAWKERIKLKTQQIQEIQECFAFLWMKETRQRVFTRWKQFSHLRRFIRERLGDQRQSLLRNTVKQWRYRAISRKRSRHCALLVADRVKLSLLLKTWKTWRSRTRLLRCVKALRGKTVSSCLRQRLHRWKRVTALFKTVKTFNHRQDTELMRMAFVDGFQRFMQLKRKENELKKQIGRVHEAYLKEWLATKLQQRMSVIAACEGINRSGSSKRLLSAVWGTWVDFHCKKQMQQASIRQFRGRISQLGERNSPLDAPKLAGMLRRWKTVQLVRVFERLRYVISAQQQVRLHTVKAIEWWHKTQCKRNFSGWKRFCQYKRKQRRIRAMNVTATLQRSWKLWQMFKIRSKMKKNVNLDIRRFHALSIYRGSFKRWREVATSLHSRRLQILELYQSSRLRLLAALIGEWRKFAAMERTNRMQKAVARVVYEQNLARRSFSKWKTNVAGVVFHRHQLQINTERLQVLLLCSSFRAWHSWAKQHKKLATIMALLSTKCHSKAASRIFTSWHLQAAKTSRLRHQSAAFWRFCRMRKGLKALRESAQEEVHLRNIHQKAQVFRLALCGSQVSVTFARWRKFAAVSRDMKEKTSVATLCWKNSFLRKAWNALVFAHQSGKADRNGLESADCHYRSRRLRKTVSFWRQLMKRNQHFRAISGKSLMRWKMQTAYHCFCALQGHAACTKKLRENEAIFTSRRRTTTVLKTWYEWRKLILVSRSGNRRSLRRFWTFWLRTHASRRVLQGFQEHIQAQVMKSTQRRCMANWKQFVATRKIEKTLVLMSTAFADTQLLKRSWLCWMKYVTQMCVAKTRMKNVLIHMQLQLQFKAFRALQNYTNLQKWKSHSTSRALAFRSHQLTTRSFIEWKAVVKERITRRRKLFHYLNIMQHSTQKKIFATWHFFVVKRKLLRLKVSQSLAMRTQLCSRMVFQTWKSFLANVQRNRLAQGFRDAKDSAHALKHWKQYVVLCKIERMINTNDRRLVESSFLSWKKRVQTHTHGRKLLASVAVGNHLRFRFMLWQQFTIHRKRLADLLLMVANPPAITLDEDQVNGNDIQSIVELHVEERVPEFDTSRTERDLVSLGHALAQKARVLQRFEVTWDLPQTWHRWRQIFHAQLFYRMRRLHALFISWQQVAHRQRRSRFIVIKLTKQRVATSALTIFRAWAELVARVKQLHKDRIREREVWVLVNTEMARRERKQLKKHWHAWKFYVEEARHLQKSLDAYHRARLLTKFWLLWCHDFRQIISDECRKNRRLEAQMRRFYLRRAVKNLRTHQQRSKRAQLVLAYFDNRHYDSLIPEVLSSWRKWSQRQKEIVCCLEAARINKTRLHFTLWKVWKNTRKWQRIAVDSFQVTSAGQKRREIWIRWRKYVKNRVAKGLTIEKAAICHLGNRLRKRWLRHTQLATKLQEQTQSATYQLHVFRCNRTVNRWRDFRRARRLRRLYQRFVLQKHVKLWQSAIKNAVATRFNEFLARSKAKKLLAVWHQVAVKHQQWRQLCVCFEERKAARTALKSFLKWQQFVNARQGKRLAGMHAEQRLLRKVWRCWDRFTLASQLRRHEQLEQAAEHEAIALLRQSLRLWQTVVNKQRERRFVLLSCVIKLQSVAGKRVQEVIFRSWKQIVDHRRRCRVALFDRERKIAKRLLFYWLTWTRDQQRSRQQLENAAVYHSQRLKSAVFFYWQTYALAWQDAVKPVSSRQMNLLTRGAALSCDTKDSEDSDDDVRRPISPVVKRLREKKASRSRAAANTDEFSDTVPLSDAVEISMDVKKRLLLLGKWKLQRNGKAKANLFSFTT